MKFNTLLGFLAILATSTAMAQSLVVFPAKDQSKEQQAKDDYECHQWAVQQSGFDPTAVVPAATQTPPATPSPKAAAKPGSGLRGAAGGAAVGAIIGEIADDDAGKGAAYGAAAGAIGGRLASKRNAQHEMQAQAQQQSAAAQQAASAQAKQYETYLKAKAACLEAKGYVVK